MAETVREDKREWFRRGVAISIIIGDGDAYRVCRFRCTVGWSDVGASSSQPDVGVSTSSVSDVGVSTSSVSDVDLSTSSVSRSNHVQSTSPALASKAGAETLTRDGLLCTLRRGGQSTDANMETFQAD